MHVSAVMIAIGCGLVANECCELTPWCARKLVRWSAFRRYTDRARAETRAEELTALVNDRPGNLLKLLTACGFAVVGAGAVTRRVVTGSRLRRYLQLPGVFAWRCFTGKPLDGVPRTDAGFFTDGTRVLDRNSAPRPPDKLLTEIREDVRRIREEWRDLRLSKRTRTRA